MGTFLTEDTVQGDPHVTVDLNRYGYGRLNPIAFRDPSGKSVVVESPELQPLVSYLESSELIYSALNLYRARPDAPNLTIRLGDAGCDPGSGQPAAGVYLPDIRSNPVKYIGLQVLRWGKSLFSRGRMSDRTITDEWAVRSAEIVVSDEVYGRYSEHMIMRTLAHEIGHAFNAMTNTDWFVKWGDIVSCGSVGIDHDDRPVEAYANDFRDRVMVQLSSNY